MSTIRTALAQCRILVLTLKDDGYVYSGDVKLGAWSAREGTLSITLEQGVDADKARRF